MTFLPNLWKTQRGQPPVRVQVELLLQEAGKVAGSHNSFALYSNPVAGLVQLVAVSASTTCTVLLDCVSSQVECSIRFKFCRSFKIELN